MNPGRLHAAGLATALAIFGLDRLVKWFVVWPLQLQHVEVIDLLPFFDLRYTQNFGVSLGMFTANSAEMRYGLVLVTGLIALGVLVWMLRETAKGDIFGLGLVLGGALGNIWDRLMYGFVIDYADLHIGEWRPFLIFNLADAAITFGVLILLARSLLSREKPAKGEPAATETN
ncbi:signal peptidase II [Novosphingobium sp. KCTC 2891]|uniref:signal peptidase II n=1 Tax=Novosphingobium sp. KCTC 2891 TaxID=2989730 RepID=UPI002221F28C|nr:signal peptidase II [Novosphingobium sp. KCTC 2891]MCW1382404.1 signal peptidase II [Novosphingobium sp. KCTC 2891]